MKVLLLNQAFRPDTVSTAQHAADLAAALADRGHDVTVVCGRRAYDNPGERYSSRDVWRGVHIRRISSFGFGKMSRWRRAADFASYLANCFLHLAILPRFDVVIAMTSPPLISSLATLFVRIKGGRLLFWAMDLNPDEALAAGWLKEESLAATAFTSLLKYSLRHSDAVVALDRFMAKRIETKGVEAAKILVLPPWSHDEIVRYDSEGRDTFRAKHGLTDKFVVMYSGNHSPCHPLTTLLQAALRLSKTPGIVFCFVGGGSEFQTVESFAKLHKLRNIVAVPYQPLNTLSSSLSSADLHVVVMGDPFVGIVHPCKVYNIRSLGIPYLYIGPAASHITELGSDLNARHGDVDTVVNHIHAASLIRPSPTPAGVTEHSQNRLVATLVQTAESLSFETVPRPRLTEIPD